MSFREGISTPCLGGPFNTHISDEIQRQTREFDAKKLTTSASKPFNFNSSVSIAVTKSQHVELFHLFFLLGMLVGKILWDAALIKTSWYPFVEQ